MSPEADLPGPEAAAARPPAPGAGRTGPDPASSPATEPGEVDLARALLASVRQVAGQRPAGPTRRGARHRPGAGPGTGPGTGPVPAAGGSARQPATGPDTTQVSDDVTAGPAVTRGGLSGPRSDPRDPQPLARAVDRMVGERGWEVPVAVGGIAGRWPELVGPSVAEHCVPEGFADGVLTVRADSTAWATQVRLLAATLVQRLNEELGPRTVTAVSVQGPSSPSWRRGRLRVPGRGPRDTYG